MTAGYHTANIVLSVLAILIPIPVLIDSLYVKKERTYRSRTLHVAIVVIYIGAVSSLIYNFLELHREDFPLILLFIFNGLFYVSVYWAISLFVMYLSCHAGYEEKTKKHSLLLMLPVIVATLIAVLAYVITSETVLYFSEYIPFLYIALLFIMLWKIDRTLVVLPAILVIIMFYFNRALYDGAIEPFLLAFCITYVYLSLRKRMILIHLGGILLTLCILTTLVIGNTVTSSAFVSYLKTIHDRNDSHLAEIESYMVSYQSLPWLMEYWMKNADAIRETMDVPNSENMSESTTQLSTITPKEAADFSADKQLVFARTCYKKIANFFETQYSIHNLDDLFLIIPNGTTEVLILFDGERNEDGTVRLGQTRDIEGDMEEWENYNTVVSDTSTWIWGQYDAEDDFGFYREISFGEHGETAYLCNSFKQSEVFEHLAFISTSRQRAMRSLALFAAIILLCVYFMLLRPLSAISDTIQRYQKDKNSHAVESDMAKIRLRNEIGTFASEFSSLATEMDRYTAQMTLLAKEKERVNTELRMATDIQLSALPRVFPAFPERKDFDIFADTKPAKEVGGDFYDFFLIDEHELAFLIADVSDKGVPAALFMMSAKNLINYRASEGGTPGEILASVNQHLCKNNTSMMFVTVWLGILDLSSGLLRYASAGHEPPAVRKGNAPFILQEEEDSCLVIGVVEDAEYTDHEIRLAPGDVVFIYTDGVTEARDVSDTLFGKERMLASLNRAKEAVLTDNDANAESSPEADKEDPPEDIVNRVKEDVEKFSEGAVQAIDVTVLAVTYKGSL